MSAGPLFIIAKIQTHLGVQARVNGYCGVCTVECYLAIRNNEIVIFTTKWKELEFIMLTSRTQVQKKSQGLAQ